VATLVSFDFAFNVLVIASHGSCGHASAIRARRIGALASASLPAAVLRVGGKGHHRSQCKYKAQSFFHGCALQLYFADAKRARSQQGSSHPDLKLTTSSTLHPVADTFYVLHSQSEGPRLPSISQFLISASDKIAPWQSNAKNSKRMF
jgi:hypothetical protein